MGHSRRLPLVSYSKPAHRPHRRLSRYLPFLSSRLQAGSNIATVFDQRTGLLYVSIRQTFALWFVPFYRAPVRLVTVLHLTQRASWDSDETVARSSVTEGREPAALAGPGQERSKYFITSQEDLYPVSDCLQFLLPGLGPLVWSVWQLFSTVICVFGSILLLPLYLLLNRESAKKLK